MDLKKYEIANEGVLLASTAAILGLGVITAIGLSASKKFKLSSRIKNMTEDEKLSRDNFLNSWIPELKKFHNDIEKTVKNDYQINKSFNVLPFISNPTIKSGYDIPLLDLNYDQLSKSSEAEMRELLDPLTKYVKKWKSLANKFSPYFELAIQQDNDTDPDVVALVNATLICKWVDKDGMLKPGLPKFK